MTWVGHDESMKHFPQQMNQWSPITGVTEWKSLSEGNQFAVAIRFGVSLHFSDIAFSLKNPIEDQQSLAQA